MVGALGVIGQSAASRPAASSPAANGREAVEPAPISNTKAIVFFIQIQSP